MMSRRSENIVKTEVFEQLKQAMREKNVLAKGVLSLLKSALDLAEKKKGRLYRLKRKWLL